MKNILLKGGEAVNMNKKNICGAATATPSLLGILGGLGPMAGVYFCEMLISHTKANSDGDHVNFLLSSRADTPDRSSFILGKSDKDPTKAMIEEAKRLEGAGAELIAIPCNTAHCFYERVCESVNVPILNIIEETAKFCKYAGVSKIGVLATEGTSASGAYPRFLDKRSVDVIPLTKDEQDGITRIIFEQIKRGLSPDLESFFRISESLKARGAQIIVLGCTELSLIKKQVRLPDCYTDSLELLALSAIARCGKEPAGFDLPLMKFYENALRH